MFSKIILVIIKLMIVLMMYFSMDLCSYKSLAKGHSRALFDTKKNHYRSEFVGALLINALKRSFLFHLQ